MTPPNAERWMRRALALARRGAGYVSPNPLVGAVLVGTDGAVLGEGWHRRYGGPHAEVEAVRDAEAKGHGGRLAECTLVVNLEPCSHWGKTPPCADLLVEKNIPSVVVGMEDPFPEVAGRGIARLRAAGIEVAVGVREREARRLNEAFVRYVTMGRPLVTLKQAQTLDGAVATRAGDSRWVSSEKSRALVHRWRAETDAVLVGAGTARADDPALTVRHVPARGWQPIRVVLDRTGALPDGLRLLTDEHAQKTVVAVAEGVRLPYAEGFEARGGVLLPSPLLDGHLSLGALLDALGRGVGPHRPVQSVLVEAGPALATALWRGDLVDRFFCFVAPKLVGGGLPALGDLGVERMADARAFAEWRWSHVGGDLLFEGFVRHV